MCVWVCICVSVCVGLHSSDPRSESGGAKFVSEKSILGGAGWWSKTGWEFSIWVGHEFVGGAFAFLYTKVFLLVQSFFH